MVSGITKAHLMPRAAQTMARPIPVLPLVGSSTIVSRLIRPSTVSASIIDTPIRSFTLWAGLKYSSLHAMVASMPLAVRLRRTSGVFPISSAVSLAMRMRRASLPGVDPRVLLPGGPGRWRRRPQASHDPPARVGRIDHVVDLEEGGGVERLAPLVHSRHHLLVVAPALDGIGDGGQLVPVAELHRALEAHPAELSGRPRHREERGVKAAARHRLRPESVGLAQDDGEERHRQVGADDIETAAVTHERGLLRLRSH